MPQYFVITDVHSFYDEMIKALDKAGFDKENPDHILVSCGDLFDRGKKPEECLNYVMSVPKERRIFIMGNHDERLKQILEGFHRPDTSDYHNKTIDTIVRLSHIQRVNGYGRTMKKIYDTNAIDICNNNQLLKEYLSECKDYYETDNYLFVHGWFPYQSERWEDSESVIDNTISYREARPKEWRIPRWDNGFWEWTDMHFSEEKGKMKIPNKTVVIGHWHVSWAHSRIHFDGQEWADKGQHINKVCKFTPFYDDRIIGLDACTVYSGFCNCICLEDTNDDISNNKRKGE